MLEGSCPKCGAHYYGWALHNPRHQMCRNCGTALIITDESGRMYTGYSPFTAENIIQPPSELSPVDEKQDGNKKPDAA